MLRMYKASGRVANGGDLHLELKTGLPDGEVEAVIVVQPVKPSKSQEDWRRLVLSFAGCMADDPLPEPPDIPLETREPLL